MRPEENQQGAQLADRSAQPVDTPRRRRAPHRPDRPRDRRRRPPPCAGTPRRRSRRRRRSVRRRRDAAAARRSAARRPRSAFASRAVTQAMAACEIGRKPIKRTRRTGLDLEFELAERCTVIAGPRLALVDHDLDLGRAFEAQSPRRARDRRDEDRAQPVEVGADERERLGLTRERLAIDRRRRRRATPIRIATRTRPPGSAP